MIIDPSTELAGHLAVAMRKHRQWASQQRLAMPLDWSEVERMFAFRATQGQGGTSLDDLWEFRESRVMEPKLLTYDEAAAVLACSTRTVKRLVVSGHLRPVKLGGVTRLRVVDVEALTESTSDDRETA